MFSGAELILGADLDLADAVLVAGVLAADEITVDPVAGALVAECVAVALEHRAVGVGPGVLATAFPAGLELLVLVPVLELVVSFVLGLGLNVSLVLGLELVVSSVLGEELPLSGELASVSAGLLVSLLLAEVAGEVDVAVSAAVLALPVEAAVRAVVDAAALVGPQAGVLLGATRIDAFGVPPLDTGTPAVP